MTKEDFMLKQKAAASAFFTDGPGKDEDHTTEEWEAIRSNWLASLAKTAVDTKRTAKARKDAAELRARAEAAGLKLVSHEQTVEEYDAAMAKLGAEVERLRAEVATLKGAD